MQSAMAVVTNFSQVLGSQLPFLGRGYAVAHLQATSITDNGIAWPYWVTGAKGIDLHAAVELQPLIGGLAGDMIGNLLQGDAGSFFGIEPMTQVVDINVTGINKALEGIKVYDAVELGYG